MRVDFRTPTRRKYADVSIDAIGATPKDQWLRRFVVLNALLFGLPVLFLAIAYFMLAANNTESPAATWRHLPSPR